MNTRAKGRMAEEIAAEFLAAKGMKILERNCVLASVEVDIIAKDGDCVVFAEVKSARRPGTFAPAEAITPEKCRRYVRAANCYLQKRRLYDVPVRFDVLEVVCDEVISHIEGAFTA